MLLLASALALLAADDPFPRPPSKKGLQVQMIDDAIELGVRHAVLNCQLGDLMAPEPAEGDPVREVDGERFGYDAGALAALDSRVRALTDGGAVVYLILLARATGDPRRDALLLHPSYDPAAPNRLSAFDATTDRGRRFLRATIDLLAERYSRGDGRHGRVWGWIVGNEVNSHHWWYNLGAADLGRVADEYERAVRLVHGAVRRHAANARVYVSLEHHWGERFGAATEGQAVPGRALLDRFAGLARERGDFDWHVAHHPYPEDLFECRFWLDTTAVDDEATPRITFANLGVLTRYLERDELRFAGAPRRVILSEQGFHCADRPGGERDQAAAFAAAWSVADRLDGVDALVLHRHVDHAHEGGLRLGLWSRREGTVCDPGEPRRMRSVFRDCDGPNGAEALEFALEVVGIRSWSELTPGG